MAKKRKYKRYVPQYWPELAWKQTFINTPFILAFCEARDLSRREFGRCVPIAGFGGWGVAIKQKNGAMQ